MQDFMSNPRGVWTDLMMRYAQPLDARHRTGTVGTTRRVQHWKERDVEGIITV